MSLNALVTAAVIALAVLAGQFAPARAADYSFELTDVISGEQVTAESSTEGKPVVVHIWSANCPHCRIHMPYAAALYDRLDPGTAGFVSICVDSTADEAREYIAERELAFPVLMGSSGHLGEDYLELGWPTTFVLNSDGSLAGWCDTQGPEYITEVLELAGQSQPETETVVIRDVEIS
jgi:thiol-disulfide isomerase/thioredoxin